MTGGTHSSSLLRSNCLAAEQTVISEAICTTNCPAIDSMTLGVKMVGCGRSSDSVSSGDEREMKRNAPATTRPCIVACESPNLTPAVKHARGKHGIDQSHVRQKNDRQPVIAFKMMLTI